MPTMRSLTVIAVVLAAALPAAAVPALAQGGAAGGAPAAVEPDARWLPWMGCWRLGEEQFEQAPDGSELPGPMFVCLSPAAEGARMTARAGDEVLVERTLVADGVRREVSDGECRGWERRDWSADGRRLFTSAEIRCGDDDAPIARSGMSLLSNASTWVDTQIVDVEGQQHLEIRRYNPAPHAESGAAESAARFDDIRQARRESASPPGLAAVREAAATADPRVVEAMLTETEPRLQIRPRHARGARRCGHRLRRHRSPGRSRLPGFASSSNGGAAAAPGAAGAARAAASATTRSRTAPRTRTT